MSKFPPPPGAFAPPPGFKAPAPAPAPFNNNKAPMQQQQFSAPPSSNGAPKSFAPPPGAAGGFKAPAPTQQQFSAPAPAKSFAPPPSSASPAPAPQQQNQNQQQPVPTGPSNPSANKYCPAGAPSPSAPAPSSNNFAAKSASSPAPFAVPPGNKGFSAPPPGGKTFAPAPTTAGKFAPPPGPGSNSSNLPTPSSSLPRPGSNSGMSPNVPSPAPSTSAGGFSPAPSTTTGPKSFPAPSGAPGAFPAPAGPGKFAPPPGGKFAPAPGKTFAPPPGAQQGNNNANNATSSVAPSPSPARPGFPAPPGFNQNQNQNQQQQTNPVGPKSFPPPGGKGGFVPPPGPGAKFPAPGQQQQNNAKTFLPPPGMQNQNQNQNQNQQQQQFNNNNQPNSNFSSPTMMNNSINNNNNFTSGGSTPQSQQLSYSSPISTGMNQQQQNQQNQNQNQQQPSGNNSFNRLPDSQMNQQQNQNQNQNQNQQQQRSSSSTNNNNYAGNIPQSSGKARMRAKPQGQNRIDSMQMPSPCRDLLVDGHPDYRYPPKPFNTTKSNQVPPTSASCTPCIDEGNCLPKFIRPTLHQLPWEESALDKAKTPWGAVVSPLASKSVNIGGSSLPIVNTPGTEPVRCSRCRAYMTSWNPFAGTGHSWVCAFCGMSNDVSEAYFSPITQNGKRRDFLDRPELCRGSYEIDVTGSEKYFAENPDTQKHIRPKPMNHLFVIDVSRNAQPHMKSLVAGIRDAVDQMPQSGYGMCGVSFVTYASTLHFYDFSDAKMPQMIVPDVDTPFVPLPFNLLCWMNVEKQRERIDAFLDLLENGSIVEAVDETGCVLGAAAKVGQLILADVGGMVIMTGTSMPTGGCGIVTERDSKFHGDPKKEPELFKPQAGFWPNLATECAKRFVSFNMFMFPSGNSCDMVTVGQLPHLTNGKQWTFSNFREESDGLRLKRRIIHALNDEAGYGAILRTRCSAGIRVKNYHGHFMQTDPQDMDLAVIDSHSTFYVAFTHDGKLEKKGGGIVQVALLYTTRSGFRRVRVHNLRMSVADTISNMFRYSDIESTVQAFISLAIHEAFNKGVKAARDWIIAKTVDLLVGYRVYSQSGSHSGQLLLPENLKLIAIYNLCLLKSDALVSGTSARFEDRVQNMFELLSYPPDQLLFYLYPRLFGLHYLSQNAGEYRLGAGDGEEEEEVEIGSRPKVFLPGLIQLTADNVYQGGIYLLQDLQARVVFLLIGSQVSPQILCDAFGCEYQEGAGSYHNMMNSISASSMDQWNPRVRRIVQQIIDETGRFVIVKEKQDTQMEDAFFRNLLEDQGPDRETCYSEFLCSLHKQINTKAKSM